MKNALKFSIETQTESGDTVSLCHLNESVISLELSNIAQIMFDLNRDLFNKINYSTKLIAGKIFRKEITKLKPDKNKLGIPLFDKYEKKEVKIADLNFVNNRLQKSESIILKNQRRISLDPSLLQESVRPGPLDSNNLTFDNVANSTKICEVEEIELFQDSGIKTYKLTDYLNDAIGIQNVSYRIEIQADTKFKEHVMYTISELKRSINFISKFINVATLEKSRTNTNGDFSDEFKEEIFRDLGIPMNEISINLGSSRIKESPFGRSAISFYNASLLINQNTSKNVYKDILLGLLPTSKTSLSFMEVNLQNFEELLSLVRSKYNIDNKNPKSSDIQLKISQKSTTLKKFITSTTEVLRIDQDPLGYNLFSEKQKGMVKFTTSTYRNRIGAEQGRYYPSVSVSDESKFLNRNERSSFLNTSNASSYVTPVNLVMPNKTITCTRGMNNIPIEDVRSFRIAKSARSEEYSRSSFIETGVDLVLNNNLNIAIGDPNPSILDRPVDFEIDPMQDARNYIGANSFFITDNPELVQTENQAVFNSDRQKVQTIISDIIPGRFLMRDGGISSIAELHFGNRKSTIRQLVTKKQIDLGDIPPQIKGMVSPQFQNNPNIDPLKNRESRAIIDETQKNIFLVRAHTGYETDEDGFPDLNKPIIEDMSSVSTNGRPVIAKAYNYEIPELGILKDKFMPTIYNNLLYIRD